MKELPKYIYKYCPITKYLFETLIRNELWFSAPFDFNDPFDCYLPFDPVYESYKNVEGQLDEMFIKENQQEIVKPLTFIMS